MVGSFGFGILSDKIGRMKALMIGLILTSTSGVLGGFMPNAIAFAIMRFITGIGAKGLFMISFVLCVEYTGPKYAALLGIAINIPFALGEMVLGLEAYFIRDWFQLQIVGHAPIILACLLWFVVPESPRWLIATGRIEKARKTIENGAKTNKKVVRK
jgi:OCT family organic cation transporter-like MFS transporter 4/5